ncbi:phosphoenolpyruvate synthase [Halobacteriovorax sp. JY17]|uniref:phosphoenolpyruvate synthase n=1 Tax=Halobacteriovorax sp. JY17 TaxID=2014617 RepID=UPI000C52DCE7|nr:phosphoenolpyruvate synthase [Halobacteriovorax sp. JY17]PIK14892.1 MAG: phosphoenolpyruvate synthase [Halobacteriovorax sp. JY17]
MLLINKKTTKNFAKKQAGGKGYNLYLLARKGINIPSFSVIPSYLFEEFVKRNALGDKITNALSNLSFKEAAAEIEKVILSGNFIGPEEEVIYTLIKSFKSSHFSVRSSAGDEDGGEHSYAGQLSSYLYVSSLEKCLESVKKCWASAFSERCLVYRKENSIELEKILVSVVIQEMIDPDASGVVFTCNPVTNNIDELMINSVYGVGEGLVSGLLEGDTYLISKVDQSLVSKEIVEKEKALKGDFENERIVEVEVSEDKRNIDSLSIEELNQLSKISIQIEELYQCAQDIEWALKDGVFYILQTRPVTTLTATTKGILNLWDNSNIVESYGGITKPLTYGFARYVYNQVYIQFCEVLMVPQNHIKEMNFFLKNMLGLFYGRVYYNLFNWYKLTSILPGYKFNRQFMETMMGTSESLGDEIAERIKPPKFHDSFGSRIRKFLTGFKFFYFHLNIQSIVDKFLTDFHRIYDVYRSKDYYSMTADQIYDEYMGLEKDILWKWHAPIINDFLCMVHFGVYKKLTEKWLDHLGQNFHNDLLAGNGNLESAEPTKQLIRLSGIVVKTEGLREFIFKNENDYLLEALNQSEYQEFYELVSTYLDKYGFRCMSEMKLEQKDMHLEPKLFFVFLKNIINSGQVDLEEFEKREHEIRANAEKLLKDNISGIKGIIYSWSLKHARKAVMNRENTRFCRTRIYGVVRSMFYAMGENFAKNGIIDRDEDIFFLDLEELKGAFEGTNSVQNFKRIIETRKLEYASYEESEPESRFMTRGPVYWKNNHFPAPVVLDQNIELKENEMLGLGCCPGIVEGVVKVIISPDDNLELNGEILVTHRTDPGWIPLYPSASALLVERGGLLSHSAIVAREMGLPTIVSIKGLTKRLETGMRIRINGESGLIEILE